MSGHVLGRDRCRKRETLTTDKLNRTVVETHGWKKTARDSIHVLRKYTPLDSGTGARVEEIHFAARNSFLRAPRCRTQKKIQKLNYIFGVSAALLSGLAAIFVFSWPLLMYDVKLYTNHKKRSLQTCQINQNSGPKFTPRY